MANDLWTSRHWFFSTAPRRLRALAWLLVVATLPHPAPLRAQLDSKVDPNAPPIAGQPDLFDGAIGIFRVSTRAAPTTVRVGEPITLTVRIEADNPSTAPRRPNLKRMAGFPERFHLAPFTNPDPDRVDPDGQAWEFDYRLRPKNDQVRAVPNLRFDFFRPGFVPPEKGYQTAWAYGPRLVLQPAETLPIADWKGAPAALHQLATGPDVLKGGTEEEPRWWGLGTVVVTAPAFCVVWYRFWRRSHPDAVSLAKRRRSRARRAAARRWRRRGIDSCEQRAAIMETYLRERFGLPIDEMTPAALADRLREQGCSVVIAERTAALFQDRAAARYAPARRGEAMTSPIDLIRLIEALEELP
jgi:hypothetical protein